MDFAESKPKSNMEAACERIQDASVISLSLYERVIDILDHHAEYADRANSNGSRSQAA